MDLTAVFTGSPEFTVLAGREEVGRVDPSVLTDDTPADRRLLLAGRSWRVTSIDWRRRRCQVEPAEHGGRARWFQYGASGLSYQLTQAMRQVLLGDTPPVRLTRRAQQTLAELRDQRVGQVHPGGTVVARSNDDVRWWTWAGYRANATLAASLPELVDPMQRVSDHGLRLRTDLTVEQWRTGVADASNRLRLPQVSEKALVGLKFSDALPKDLATATLAARLADFTGARAVLEEPTRFLVVDGW